MILKSAVSRLSIRSCPRVHHPRSSSTLDVLTCGDARCVVVSAQARAVHKLLQFSQKVAPIFSKSCSKVAFNFLV